MTYASICATDIEEWQYGPMWVASGEPNPLSGRMAPLILGHEAAGEVVALGEGASGLEIGDRVVVDNVRTCGECYWCLRGESAVCPSMSVFGLSDDGGLAEFAKWRANQCIILPDPMSNEEAPLSEPTTVAVHAARRSGIRTGDNVAVIGCGTVGLLTVQVLKASGARVIAIDQRQESLDLADALGADETLDARIGDHAARVLELTSGVGPDIVFETAGAKDTPVEAISLARRGGKVVLVGIYSATPEVDFNEVVGVERTIIGSVATTHGDYRTAVNMIGAGQVNVRPLISAKLSLDRAIPDGFERMLRPEKDVYRIIVGGG
jgi:(R,R)-butanediol dehydrogenase/meso-butanediol dehydrogenase/diacetyl reductase